MNEAEARALAHRYLSMGDRCENHYCGDYAACEDLTRKFLAHAAEVAALTAERDEQASAKEAAYQKLYTFERVAGANILDANEARAALASVTGERDRLAAALRRIRDDYGDVWGGSEIDRATGTQYMNCCCCLEKALEYRDIAHDDDCPVAIAAQALKPPPSGAQPRVFDGEDHGADWNCPKCGAHRTVTPALMAKTYAFTGATYADLANINDDVHWNVVGGGSFCRNDVNADMTFVRAATPIPPSQTEGEPPKETAR